MERSITNYFDKIETHFLKYFDSLDFKNVIFKQVCMNRHGNGYQETTSDSLNDTNLFVTSVLQRKSDIVLPIVTPRFAPSCDEQLLLGLGEIAKKYNVRYAKNRFFRNSEL